MTLHRIVSALGGDLYQGGHRANVPAPGHSAQDRSVSLLLSDERLVIHGFGGADWRDVRDHLLGLGLIDRLGRPVGGPRFANSGAPRPVRMARIATARRLWEEASPLSHDSLSHRHLLSRAILSSPDRLEGLRHHPVAPVAVFRTGGVKRPALVARISAPAGHLTAVELVYLEPNGRRADRLKVPRKMVGVLPAGSAVRLAPATDHLLVGEGVMTVLSASERFGLPAWALLSAHNLSTWSAPVGVRRVLIAADRGLAGETAAERLQRRLSSDGIEASIALPPVAFDDWNSAAVGKGKGKGGA